MRFIIASVFCIGLVACAAQPAEVTNTDRNYGTFSSAQDADPPPPDATQDANTPIGNETYNRDEVINAANTFFGENTKGLALAVEKAFSDYGNPVAYIVGEEGSGAIVVGLRYGQGVLTYKGGASVPVYWQGPSIGWDFGGNASKVFTLVYNLHNTNDLFQRFPAVDGSLYIVAGLGMNYQRSGDIVLAPIRTGVGLRAGASLGYVSYTRTATANPF